MRGETLVSVGRGARRLLPERLILHSDYFLVRKLAELADADESALWRQAIAGRLRKVLLEAVEHTPYYQGGRVTPACCRNEDPFAALAEFPFITKTEVMADPGAFLSRRAPRFMRYRMNASGSSGQRMTMWRTKRLADIERAFLDHHWSRWGWRADASRILRMADEGHRPADDYPAWRSANRLMASPFHLTDRWLPAIYDEAVRFAPEFVHAFSSCAVELARFINRSGRPPLRVKALMLTSEPLRERDLPELHAAFAAPIAITYGLTERTNFAVAVVMPGETRLVYRLSPVYGLQENYAHTDGQQEIVGTSYWNTVMPLIRYRTGDYGQLADGVIKRLDGRDYEFLLTKDGGRMSGASIDFGPGVWDAVSHLQFRQTRQGEAVVRVVPAESCTQSDIERIGAMLSQQCAGFIDLSIEVMSQIPKSPSGKTRMFVRDA
jgi:phenylacetate-CoA ligase